MYRGYGHAQVAADGPDSFTASSKFRLFCRGPEPFLFWNESEARSQYHAFCFFT